MSLLRTAYGGLAWLGAPLIGRYLHIRAAKGREDKNRLSERQGITKVPRPEAPLVWIHAVSVGEAVEALALIQLIMKKFPDLVILLTTTTLASARFLEERLPKRAIHQFCPVDTPQAVRRFLDHWQPDLTIWLESELWPNLMHGVQQRGIPTILLNGRMSNKSVANWKKAKGMIASLLSRLDLCAVQSDAQAALFRDLGAENVVVMGNIKLMIPPLAVESSKYEELKKAIGDRPLWLAASTHPGEEEAVIQAHKILQKDYPDLLTIIVPRHIERAPLIQKQAEEQGLKVSLRTQAQENLRDADIYIANTLGELSLFYALTSVVFVGGTLSSKGGHNPIEAAQLGAFVLHGSHTFKNPQLYEVLESLELSKCVSDEQSLASNVKDWLDNQKELYAEPFSLAKYREEGLNTLAKLLTPYLVEMRGVQE